MSKKDRRTVAAQKDASAKPPPPEVGADKRRLRADMSKRALDAPEEDAAVVPAEAHRVRERDGDLGAPRFVRDVVEIALGVRLAVVDRRRQDAVAQREHAQEPP